MRVSRSVATTLALFGLIASVGACSDMDSTPVATPSSTAEILGDITVHRLAYDTSATADLDQNWGDLYLPAGEQTIDSTPLVVLIHGGSWKSQLDAQTMRAYAMDLAERGMAVYNIEYRRVGSGGGWPTTFTDVANALDFVPEIDKRFPQITVDDELVVGHSAGAQLAMWAGTRNQLNGNEVGHSPKFRPTRVVSLAGPLDMVYAAEHGNDRIVTVLGGTPHEVPDRYASVDPIQNIDATMPVVAVHGTADTLVPPVLSERYIAEVDRRNGIGDLVLLKGQDHVSIVSSDSPEYGTILDIITDSSTKSVGELDESYAE